MKRKEKVKLVQQLKERMEAAQGTALFDFSGLKASKMDELRRKLEEREAEILVAKRTLINRALEMLELPDRPSALPKGQTALVFAKSLLPTLKTLREFLGGKGMLKGGIFEGKWLRAPKMEELAVLPSRETLLSKIVLTLRAPVVRLINGLSWNQKKLIFTLEEVKGDQKS